MLTTQRCNDTFYLVCSITFLSTPFKGLGEQGPLWCACQCLGTNTFVSLSVLACSICFAFQSFESLVWQDSYQQAHPPFSLACHVTGNSSSCIFGDCAGLQRQFSQQGTFRSLLACDKPGDSPCCISGYSQAGLHMLLIYHLVSLLD